MPDIASQWQQLVAVAVMGTDRGHAGVPTLPGNAGKIIAAIEPPSSEQRLLCTAAILAIQERAGRRPAPAGPPEPPPASEDDLPSCSRLAGTHLSRILNERSDPLLIEWCEAAVAAGVRAPDEWLPTLLTRAASLSAPSLIHTICGVVGRRGRWLAGQHPEWSGLFAEVADPDSIWDTGERPKRLSLMRSLRNTDPAKGRLLASATWAQESPEDRVAILELMGEGLGTEDEAFLEAALDDKRKPVRTAAADLLACLPTSRLSSRMTDRVAPLVQFHTATGGLLRRRKIILKVALPEKADKALSRDGIEFRKTGQLGPSAFALSQMMAAVPLDAWANWSGLSPEEMIQTAVSDEWANALARGWSIAAVRQHHEAWALALLNECWVPMARKNDPAEGWDAIEAIMRGLSAGARERVVADLLKERWHYSKTYLLIRFILTCNHTWSTDFSRSVLDSLRNHMARREGVLEHLSGQKTVQEIAERMSPELADEAATGWPKNSGNWSEGCDEVVSRLTATLLFRRDFLKELRP